MNRSQFQDDNASVLPQVIFNAYTGQAKKCVAVNVDKFGTFVICFGDGEVKYVKPGEKKFVSAVVRLDGETIDFLLSDGSVFSVDVKKFR